MLKRKYFEYVLLIVAVVAASGLINALKTEATPKSPPVPTNTAISAASTHVPTVSELLELTNAERAKAGAAPLALDERLNRSAQMKADEIHTTKVFEHAGATGKHGLEYVPETGLTCTTRIENLAADMTSSGAINDWMNSPPHKAGMLRLDTQLVGFGISEGPGYSYVVGHYCQL